MPVGLVVPSCRQEVRFALHAQELGQYSPPTTTTTTTTIIIIIIKQHQQQQQQ